MKRVAKWKKISEKSQTYSRAATVEKKMSHRKGAEKAGQPEEKSMMSGCKSGKFSFLCLFFQSLFPRPSVSVSLPFTHSRRELFCVLLIFNVHSTGLWRSVERGEAKHSFRLGTLFFPHSLFVDPHTTTASSSGPVSIPFVSPPPPHTPATPQNSNKTNERIPRFL